MSHAGGTYHRGRDVGFVPRTVFAIGRNYAEHARELGNELPSAPMYFLKAASSVVGDGAVIPLPPGAAQLHHEVELVAILGAGPDGASRVEAWTVGVDLTDRVRQNELKAKGNPWAAAKSFRGAAALAPLVPASAVPDPQALRLTLKVGGQVRQDAPTSLMIFPVSALLDHLRASHDLEPGDVVFTGTPSGVGPVGPGDVFDVELRTADGGNLLTLASFAIAG